MIISILITMVAILQCININYIHAENIDIESISLNPLGMPNVGTSFSIYATITPSTATDQSYTWTSSNEEVASVVANGVGTNDLGTYTTLNCLSTGTTTITVKTSNNLISSRELTVKNKSDIYLDAPSDMYIGQELNANVVRDDNVQITESYTFTNSDESVLSLSGGGNGRFIKSLKEGSSVITAVSESGKTLSRTVNVVALKSISIETSPGKYGTNTYEEVENGSNANFLSVRFDPKVTDSNGMITWESSNTNIANITYNRGNYIYFSSKALGPATITATALNGLQASVTVKSVTPTTSLSFKEYSTTLKKGNTYQIEVEQSPTDADDTIVWSSSDTNVLQVDTKGLVTAISCGTATVFASGIKVQSSCFFTVLDFIPITSLSFKESSVTLKEGDTYQIEKEYSPSNADEPLSWSSSDPNVLKVDDQGLVTAISCGTAFIFAKGMNVQSNCYFIVNELIPRTITLNENELTLYPGDKDSSLTATIAPENATNKAVTWTSSNTDVATIDSNGSITALSVGITTIDARLSNGRVAECKVNVLIRPLSLTLQENSVTVFAHSPVGPNWHLLIADIDPFTAAGQIIWSSSDNSIATVKQDESVNNWAKVYAENVGTATITAKTGNGLSATCKVTVIPSADKVELNKNNLSLFIGEESQLTASVSPNDKRYLPIQWFSDHENVATVKDGLVKAISQGRTSIEAMSIDGTQGYSSVTVSLPITEIKLSDTNLNMYVGNNQKITATVLPEEALLKDLSWSSNNAAVATVDQAGDVTAVGTGTATITAVSLNGTVSTCKIVVTQPVTNISLNKSVLSLVTGGIETLTASIAPENTSNKNVTWSSSDESVAKVNQTGKVTAIKAGTAVITVTTEDAKKTATCNVTVTKPTPTPAPSVAKQEMYRLYNPNSGEHFYTKDSYERDQLASIGWVYEGVGWIAPATSNTPVYRMYNPNAGEHHYTTNAGEKDMLTANGWNYEGIGWYSDDAQGVPLYRQYNPNAFSCNHNYTVNKSENDWLVSLGWNAEGIGWYGVK